MWSTSKYKLTHQGNLAFHSRTRPAVYDSTISDDDKPSVIQKKEITCKARMNEYKMFSKAKLETCALILRAFNKTSVLELKDEETLFTQVTPRQLLDNLQSICGGLHDIEVLTLQNEMQEYHKDSEGILEYIKSLESAQKKSKRCRGNKPITDETLLVIATDMMLKTGSHTVITDNWEDLDAA